ncbi:hypothetical protein [Streptomyces sp. ISL-99]|uniref:hypothetical protein n=1 Tax=Streptomyces sp. ISL-99 TaxID=2819193 RepID=UPI00203638A2|nr:hypothetical protein [Streptomyces sp. ISL-99]
MNEVPWDELDLDTDEDPRLLFGLKELSFGTTDGLWPIASTDRGETIFLAPGSVIPRLLVEDGEIGWTEHHMSFAEWVYRYLIGEDMAGPNSSAFYPGPVQLQRLPCPPPNAQSRGAARNASCIPRQSQGSGHFWPQWQTKRDDL